MAVKKHKFEESLEKLEEVAEQIKSGNLTLDESIKAFEQGITYYEVCNDILKQAKQKIEVFEK